MWQIYLLYSLQQITYRNVPAGKKVPTENVNKPESNSSIYGSKQDFKDIYETYYVSYHE